MKRLSELEAEEQEAVRAFTEAHPDLVDPGFERNVHERRWVGDRNLTTYPIDPHMLNEMDLGAAPGSRSTQSGPAQSDGEFEDTGTAFRSLFPPSDARTKKQEAQADLVEAAFQQMRPGDVFLLQRRYIELLTLDAIAAEEGVTRQAIIKRLVTAEKNMREVLYALRDGDVAFD